MSDNGGLRIAFDAYQKHVKDNVSDGILPGFENFTREQLFFISHGLFTCATGQKSLNEFALVRKREKKIDTIKKKRINMNKTFRV